MKATAMAPSNIAFIKYWGKVDEGLRLPANGSLSVNLSGLTTKTTVEFSERYQKDEVLINNKIDSKKTERVIKHLDLIRKKAGIKKKAKVVSVNNFPMAAGLASSASGFAALTLAGSKAAGLNLPEKELSILARIGSGSACRSIPPGFVEWMEGGDETSFAKTIFPANYWDIAIITVIVSTGEKTTGSTLGMELAKTSPFFKTRLSLIKQKLEKIKKIIKEKKFCEFGKLVEEEALELHAIMLTSKPSLIYWTPKTLEIMRFTHMMRKEKLEVYFTIDAGPHIYLICPNKDKEKVIDKLKSIKEIEIIVNEPANGAKLIQDHLF